MVFSALAFAQCEVIWYFQHVGIASSKSKTTRIVPVDIVSHVCPYLSRSVMINVLSWYVQPDNEVLDFNYCVFFFGLQDPSDPTIGFLLDGMDHLCCLVRKYIAG